MAPKKKNHVDSKTKRKEAGSYDDVIHNSLYKRRVFIKLWDWKMQQLEEWFESKRRINGR